MKKKWGNFLNWTAQKVFSEENWAAVGKKLGGLIASAANKVAPGLGDKILTAVGAGTSASGVGLIILGAQVLWEVGKSMFGKLKGFVASLFSGKPDKALLSSAFLVVNGFLAGIPVLLIASVEALKFLLHKLWDTLLAILALAFIIVIAYLIIGGMLFNNFVTTTNLDSGSPLLTDGGAVIGNGCVQTVPVKGEIWQGPHGGYSHSSIVALDIHLLKDGVPIRSASGGKVIYSGYNGVYGNRLDIQSDFAGKTVTFIYGHLASAAVRMGQSVAPGQVIGYGDSTSSNSFFRSPHLHFEIRGISDYKDCPIPGTNPTAIEKCDNRESCNASI